MDNPGGVDVFEPPKYLVEEVLDELFLERSRCDQSVKIGPEELGDEVAVKIASARCVSPGLGLERVRRG